MSTSTAPIVDHYHVEWFIREAERASYHKKVTNKELYAAYLFMFLRKEPAFMKIWDEVNSLLV
jgi:hypothetical protein